MAKPVSSSDFTAKSPAQVAATRSREPVLFVDARYDAKGEITTLRKRVDLLIEQAPTPIVDLTKFGAVSGGIVDNTQAILAWKAAALATGAALYAPSGVYATTSSAMAFSSAFDGFVIYGDGDTRTEFKMTDSAPAFLDVSAAGLSFDDISFNAATLATSVTRLVTPGGSRNHFHRCAFKGGGAGALLADGGAFFDKVRFESITSEVFRIAGCAVGHVDGAYSLVGVTVPLLRMVSGGNSSNIPFTVSRCDVGASSTYGMILTGQQPIGSMFNNFGPNVTIQITPTDIATARAFRSYGDNPSPLIIVPGAGFVANDISSLAQVQ